MHVFTKCVSNTKSSIRVERLAEAVPSKNKLMYVFVSSMISGNFTLELSRLLPCNHHPQDNPRQNILQRPSYWTITADMRQTRLGKTSSWYSQSVLSLFLTTQRWSQATLDAASHELTDPWFVVADWRIPWHCTVGEFVGACEGSSSCINGYRRPFIEQWN